MKKLKSFTSDEIAYKGFLIRHNKIHHIFYISKNGHSIGSAKSLEHAKHEIDHLQE
jgi:hypothetical protein